jgi:hypothetical protein
MAAELQDLGHGVFTYLIAEEIEKKDTTEPITAHGIAQNIAQTLPKRSKELLAKKILKSIQEPTVYTKGDDFILRDSQKEKK